MARSGTSSGADRLDDFLFVMIVVVIIIVIADTLNVFGNRVGVDHGCHFAALGAILIGGFIGRRFGRSLFSLTLLLRAGTARALLRLVFFRRLLFGNRFFRNSDGFLGGYGFIGSSCVFSLLVRCRHNADIRLIGLGKIDCGFVRGVSRFEVIATAMLFGFRL